MSGCEKVTDLALLALDKRETTTHTQIRAHEQTHRITPDILMVARYQPATKRADCNWLDGQTRRDKTRPGPWSEETRGPRDEGYGKRVSGNRQETTGE